MSIAVLGNAGLGLVWGWLMGSLGGQVLQLPKSISAISGATLLLAAEVLFLTNWQLLALFFSMTVLSLLLHLAWRRELHNRFGSLM